MQSNLSLGHGLDDRGSIFGRGKKINFSSTGQLQNVHGITLFLRNTKQYNHLSYTGIKTVLLCNYKFLLAIINVLKFFLEVIL